MARARRRLARSRGIGTGVLKGQIHYGGKWRVPNQRGRHNQAGGGAVLAGVAGYGALKGAQVVRRRRKAHGRSGPRRDRNGRFR